MHVHFYTHFYSQGKMLSKNERMEEVHLPIDVLDDGIVNHGKIDKMKWAEEKQNYRGERKKKNSRDCATGRTSFQP